MLTKSVLNILDLRKVLIQLLTPRPKISIPFYFRIHYENIGVSSKSHNAKEVNSVIYVLFNRVIWVGWVELLLNNSKLNGITFKERFLLFIAFTSDLAIGIILTRVNLDIYLSKFLSQIWTSKSEITFIFNAIKVCYTFDIIFLLTCKIEAILIAFYHF